ncbi:MAG: hypothetical protein RL040_1102, partial [Bacteroidota bacterium]
FNVALYCFAKRSITTDIALDNVGVALVHYHQVIVFIENTEVLYGAHDDGLFRRLSPFALAVRLC